MLYALVAIMGLGLVDSYFISFLGTQQLAAIGFIVPIVSIVTSIGLGLGMAISSLTSKLIGANGMSRAARLITDGFYLTALVAVITVVVLVIQVERIFQLLGANQVTLAYILEYMHVWLFAAPFTMFTMVCSSTFRAIGDTSTSANIAISMTLTNAILDPLFIFGWGPVPAMGMAGAALATVVAVLLSTIIGFYHLGVKEKLLLWLLPKWHDFKVNLSQLLEIAIPAVMANVIVPTTAASLTALVAVYGTDAVAGYGVGVRVEMVSLIIVYALSSTLPMFIGQNLGAQKHQRIHQALRLSFKFVVFLQLGVYLLLLVSARLIAEQFSEVPQVQQTIIYYLWIVPLSYGLSGVVVLVNVSMNVLGKPRLALYINSLKLVLFYLPLAYSGSQLYGIKGLFIGIALGNVCIFLVANWLLKRTLQGIDLTPANT